ncbi:MAG: hypothetical protein WBB39_02565 [Candidatus Saccharimonadales bacterium]
MAAIKRIVVGASLALVATLVALPVHATNDRVTGNNGTLKVHEQGTPSNTENNDPKVCTFNYEGYGFDKGQDGLIIITKQGGGNDKSEVKRLAMPAAKESAEHFTFTETSYITLPDGMYKSTVYGKDNRGEYTVDLKAKSKVFKVECDDTDTNSGNGNNDGGQGDTNGGSVNGTSTTTTSGQGAALPSVIASTGPNPLQTIANTLFAGAGVYTALLRRKQ